MIAPPLAHVTGTVEPGECFGSFGPVDAFQWRGSCVGGCGARPGCREEGPAPECSGCARARHGITHTGGAIGRPGPVPPRILVGELERGAPVPKILSLPQRPIVMLREATEISTDDASLPRGVRALVELGGPGVRVFAAVAQRVADGAVSATLAVRLPGVGYALYERPEGGAWAYARGALLHPHVRRAGANEIRATLTGEAYLPPAPKEPPPKGTCPTCGGEASLTKTGTVFKSHRCASKQVEGRS